MYRQIQSASKADSFVVENDKFRKAYIRLIICFNFLIQNSAQQPRFGSRQTIVNFD